MTLTPVTLLVLAFVVAQAFPATAVTLVATPAPTIPFRVLVDASKDGGIWWFPQGPHGFDPAKPHQGKDMADAMRAKGWEVTELPRETVITSRRLTGFDLVIRPPAHFPYSEAEVSAYRDSVASGTRLLIMDQSEPDRVAEGFQVRFGPRNQLVRPHKLIPHPLTANLGCCDLTWRPIIETPGDAVLLAWLNAQDPGGAPVLAYQIVILGAAAHIPLFNSKTDDSEATIPRQQGRILGRKLIGWTWQVRAQDRDGRWGDWSLSRTFDVLPLNK